MSDHSQFYLEYLQSFEWQQRRLAALRRAHNCCERCSAPRLSGVVLQVHHKSYERLGKELPTDLEVLCLECHKEADHERRVKAWAKKKFGEYWEDEHSFEDIDDMFGYWLEGRTDYPEETPDLAWR